MESVLPRSLRTVMQKIRNKECKHSEGVRPRNVFRERGTNDKTSSLFRRRPFSRRPDSEDVDDLDLQI